MAGMQAQVASRDVAASPSAGRPGKVLLLQELLLQERVHAPASWAVLPSVCPAGLAISA